MSVLEETIGLISEKLMALKALGTIIKLEIRLAGLSLFPLLLNICMLLVVSLTLWLCSMALIGNLFFTFLHNSLLAITAVLLLNGLFFIGLLKYLSFNIKKMSFEKTRKYLLDKETEHEQKKKIDDTNSRDGKNLSVPSDPSTSA